MGFLFDYGMEVRSAPFSSHVCSRLLAISAFSFPHVPMGGWGIGGRTACACSVPVGAWISYFDRPTQRRPATFLGSGHRHGWPGAVRLIWRAPGNAVRVLLRRQRTFLSGLSRASLSALGIAAAPFVRNVPFTQAMMGADEPRRRFRLAFVLILSLALVPAAAGILKSLHLGGIVLSYAMHAPSAFGSRWSPVWRGARP